MKNVSVNEEYMRTFALLLVQPSYITFLLRHRWSLFLHQIRDSPRSWVIIKLYLSLSMQRPYFRAQETYCYHASRKLWLLGNLER